MTNKFIQHIPPFVEGSVPKSFEFETQQDLVCMLKELGYGTKEGSWFEISNNLIMEVSDEGHHWWACGWVKNPKDLTFGTWEPKYRPKLTTDQLIQQNDEALVAEGITTYKPESVSISIGGKVLEGCCDNFVLTVGEIK